MTPQPHNARYAKLRRQVGGRDFNSLNDLLRQITSCRTGAQTDQIWIYNINDIFQKQRGILPIRQNGTNGLVDASRYRKKAGLPCGCSVHCEQDATNRKHFRGRSIKPSFCYEMTGRDYIGIVQFSTINPRDFTFLIILLASRKRCATRHGLKNCAKRLCRPFPIKCFHGNTL